MERLSILTSSYNSKKYLKEFMKNVSKQTYQDYSLCFEHICPTNSEKKIIQNSKFDKNKLIYSEQEKKITLSATWNNLINKSNSKYLCIWNTDDLRTKDSLEKMINLLEANPNIDFVYGNYFIVDRFKKKTGNYINEKGREAELKSSMILGPFFMFKRDVLESIGKFDEQLISGADYDFAMRLARKHKGKHLNSNLGYYLNTGEGLSTNKNTLQEIERTLVEMRYNIDIINKEFIDTVKKDYDLRSILVDGRKLKLKNFHV